MRAKTSIQSGFTLLELTAVVVLLALVTAAVVPGLARRSDSAARAGLIAGLIDLDARARLNAPRNDVCFLTIDEQENQITLTVFQETEAVVLGRVEIPNGVLVRFHEAEPAISFDRSGYTGAYGYEIHAGTQTLTIWFNGLTGWHVIEEGGSE